MVTSILLLTDITSDSQNPSSLPLSFLEKGYSCLWSGMLHFLLFMLKSSVGLFTFGKIDGVVNHLSGCVALDTKIPMMSCWKPCAMISQIFEHVCVRDYSARCLWKMWLSMWMMKLHFWNLWIFKTFAVWAEPDFHFKNNPAESLMSNVPSVQDFHRW